MALLDNLFKKTYTIMCYCNNCSVHSEVKVPKGVTVIQFLETGQCPSCNCTCLIADYRQIDEFKEQPKPQVKLLRIGRRQDVEPPKRASVPPQRPSNRLNRPANRPANSLPPRRPAPVEPDFTPKGIFRNDIDFWTGKQLQGREK